jgi:predicted nucleic acid-binding protein
MLRFFIDTNIVIYANDRRAGDKQAQAIAVVTELIRSQTGAISIQVLQEYANTALAKLNQEATVVLRQLRLLESLHIVLPSTVTVRRAVEIREAYQVSFWDAAIIAAAEEAGCDAILSEDLNPGQYYAGVQVVNPFAPGFEMR